MNHFDEKNNVAHNQSTMQFYKKKENMFKEQRDKAVYIARDIKINESYTDFSCCESFNELTHLCHNDNHLYEIIKSDKPRYSYFDIDASYINARKILKEDKYEDEKFIEDYLLMILLASIEDFKEDNDINCDPDYVVLSATNKVKISLHVIDRSITFKNQEDSKVYHHNFIKSVNDDLGMCFIDRGVYTSDRNFRMVNQTKFKVNATPLKIKSDHDIKDTFITNVSPELTHFTPFKRWLKKKTCIITPIKEDITDDENNELDLLISKLDNSRFDDYNNWTKTVWCLFACGCSSNRIHLESSIRVPEKYDYEGCESQIKQYDHDKSKFNINTLRAWAKQDSGFESERVLEKKIRQQPKKREDHFQFIDLLKKYDGKTFINDLGIEEFTQDVSSCVQMVIGASTTFCVYENDDEQFSLSKTLSKVSFTVRHETDIESTEKKWNLQNYMINNPLKFPLFNKIVFKPNNHGIKRHELNVFSNFKAQEVDEVDMRIVNVFKNHIFEIWADSNETNYKYIMSWIAQIIKTPHRKTEVALLLQGGMGTGKTLPCDFLYNWVFGKNLSLTASGLQSMTQRFNGSVMGKVFAKVDELSVISDSFNAAFDKMKSLITDRNIQIEKKGLEHIEIDNYINMILTTNHRHTVKLERDDRRYACFCVSEKHKQDDDYFSIFMDTLDNQNAGDNVYTYFLRYPNDEMVNLRRIPKTSFRDDLIESNKNTVERFIDCMNESFDSNLLYDWKGKENEDAITISHFYQCYKDWCYNVGEKAWSMKAVTSDIKHSDQLLYTGKKQINGKQNRYYVFKN